MAVMAVPGLEIRLEAMRTGDRNDGPLGRERGRRVPW